MGQNLRIIYLILLTVTLLQVYLLDFGASRDYSKQFVDDYLRVIHSAVVGDREGVINASKALGYLTGYESKVCLVM